MAKTIRVLGVHHVIEDTGVSSGITEPVHLIEIEFEESDGFDFAEVTQEIEDQPPENWQVAYDESELERGSVNRYCFFFHCLDLGRPLLTSYGLVQLPQVTPLPSHLAHIEYDQP